MLSPSCEIQAVVSADSWRVSSCPDWRSGCHYCGLPSPPPGTFSSSSLMLCGFTSTIQKGQNIVSRPTMMPVSSQRTVSGATAERQVSISVHENLGYGFAPGAPRRLGDGKILRGGKQSLTHLRCPPQGRGRAGNLTIPRICRTKTGNKALLNGEVGGGHPPPTCTGGILGGRR